MLTHLLLMEERLTSLLHTLLPRGSSAASERPPPMGTLVTGQACTWVLPGISEHTSPWFFPKMLKMNLSLGVFIAPPQPMVLLLEGLQVWGDVFETPPSR